MGNPLLVQSSPIVTNYVWSCVKGTTNGVVLSVVLGSKAGFPTRLKRRLQRQRQPQRRPSNLSLSTYGNNNDIEHPQPAVSSRQRQIVSYKTLSYASPSRMVDISYFRGTATACLATPNHFCTVTLLSYRCFCHRL